MKKNVFTLGLITVAAMTLTTNCAKNETETIHKDKAAQEVVKGTPFEIIAGDIETKTTNDGMATKWEASDAINVFYADAGTTSYTSAGKFDSQGTGSSVSFTGTVGDLNDNNDWYVFYPYKSGITTPANTSTFFVSVGGNQTQGAEATATAHLCGEKFPVYGKAENVAKTTTPSITMKPAMSVVKVHVTNNSGAALTVNTVNFTTEDYAISGQFYIDFTGAEPVFTEKSGSTGKSSTLTVTGGKTLASGATADFYIGVVPFVAASGKKLTVKVNDYSKEITLSSEATFAAGKMKTLNFDYDETISPASLPFSITGSGGSAAYSTTTGLSAYGLGTDYNSSTHGVYITKLDDTGDYVQLFCNAAASSVSFAVKMIGGNTSSSMKLTGSADGVTFNDIETFAISGAQHDIKNFTSSITIDDTYRYFRLTFTKGSNVGLGPFSVESAAAPSITASNISDVPAVGVADATTTYTINNFSGDDDVTATADGDVVTTADVTSAGTVTYTVAPNYTTGSKNGTITLESPRDGANKVIHVTQLGETFSVSATTVYVPKDATSATFTLTTASFNWNATVNQADGKNLTATSTNGTKNADAQTFTVNSTTAPAEDADITLGSIVLYRTASANDDPQKKTITIKKAPLATVLYSCGFESGDGFSTTGTSYTTLRENVGPTGQKWTMFGEISTSSKITGANSLALRRYKTSNDSTNPQYAVMNFDVTGVPTKVAFNAKVANTGLKLTVLYSTDSGANWSTAINAKTFDDTSTTACEITVTGSPTKYRLKFVIDSSSSKPSSGNWQMTIDDIKILKVE